MVNNVDTKKHEQILEQDDSLDFDLDAQHDSQTEFERILEESENRHTQHENILYTYYAEIGEYDLLTPEEEREVALKAKEGDRVAINTMVERNLRLVISVAQKYENRGLDLLDLISEGNFGLMHAIGKFEPEKGYRFSTYAVWWIRHYIERAIMNLGRTIRLPIHVNKAINSQMRVQKEISAKLNREATLEEVAKEVDKPLAEVMDLYINNESTLSLDAEFNSDGSGSFYDVVESDRDMTQAIDSLLEARLYQGLEAGIAELDEESREVIELRFGVNGREKTTLEKTGQMLGISRDKVRQIQLKALDKLKRIMHEEADVYHDLAS